MGQIFSDPLYLPCLDIFLIVHLREQLDFNDLQDIVLIPQIYCVILRIAYLFDPVQTQLSNCGHFVLFFNLIIYQTFELIWGFGVLVQGMLD